MAFGFLTQCGLVGIAAGALALWLHLRRSSAVASRSSGISAGASSLPAVTRGLAHELKNPLSTIGLNVQLLGESIAESMPAGERREAAHRRVRTISMELDRLRGILEDFERYAGEIHLEPATVDLCAVLAELVDFYLPQAESRGVRLHLDTSSVQDSTAVAHADAGALKQAILNLLLNATHALEGARGPGGAVSRVDGCCIEVRLVPGHLRSSRVWRIHVSDTGPGVPEGVAGQIFSPYYTTTPGGAGLGLAITQRIAEAHGGSVELGAAGPGSGADFVVTLPRP